MPKLGFSSFDWINLAKDAKNYPFSKGIFVTLMLFSTLLPTLLHLIIAVIAVSLTPFGRDRILALMNNPIIDDRGYALIAFWYISLFGFSVIFTVGFFVIVFYFLIPQFPIAEMLYNLVIRVYG